MFELFLRLFGVKGLDNGEIVHSSIYFSNLKSLGANYQILMLAIAAAAAAYGVWWFYKREPDYCSQRKRRVLAGLRYSGILILLFIISGPVLQVTLRGFVKGKVVILVDASKSMTRVDKYSRPEDKLVAAHVLGKIPLKETNVNKLDGAIEKAVSEASRLDLMRAMFANSEIGLLPKLQEKYDVEMWSFARASDMHQLLHTDGRNLDAGVLDKMQADGVLTEIGGSMRKTMNRLKGHALSAIILATDGGNNKGEDPAVVAQDSPVRIFPIGIGVPESRDVAVSYLFMEDKIFVDDPAPIYVRLKQHGFSGEQAQLVVTSDGAELGRQPVTLRDTGEQTEIVRVRAKKPGKYTYKVEIQLLNAAAEDSEPGNNFKSREVEVIDQKINVLILESEPRWEYRYLKNALLRDKRVNCKILLRVPDMAELAKSGGPYLKEFPSREELFKFHVIVFGNMPNDGFFTEKDIDNLRRFVLEEGGGIWFIAGKNNLPDSYKDSKLELLLPIEFERMPDVSSEDEMQSPLTDPFHLVLTPEGKSHSLTHLDAGSGTGGDDQNAALWDMVPEMYWYHKATRAKLGASVLMAYGADKGTASLRGGPAPLMVTSQVGRGRVLYQAFADLWRMRYPAELGPDALERFHGHVIQYLGLAKLLGRTARVEINTDREEYAVGDRVKISARVLTKTDLEYSTADHVTAVMTDSDNEASQINVDLTPEPGQRGMFRGETAALQEGKFRVTLKEQDDEQAHADLRVIVPQIEMDSPDMKKEVLENIAKSSVRGSLEGDAKANMYLADQAGELLKDLNQAQHPMEEDKKSPLWDAPILLLLFTFFMGSEWLIRKRSDLL